MNPPHHLRAAVTALLALLALSLAASAPARAQAQPTISIDDPSPENEGSTIEFTVELSGVPDHGLSVRYQSRALPGEAEEGENCGGKDYMPASGLIVFAADTQTLRQTIPVLTCEDDLDEPDE